MLDCTVVILAGGQGVRLGRLGQFASKALLVAYDRPLLARHLDHLIEAGFRRIVVSTNPTHYPSLLGLATDYQPNAEADIRVVENMAHLTGPIEALHEVVKGMSTRRGLMVLVDEYILDNSFYDFSELVAGEDDYTAVAPVIHPNELKRGGYVRCEGARIERFVERAEDKPTSGYPSPGTSLFTVQDTQSALTQFLKESPGGASVGDFYNFRCLNGHPIYALMGSDFININTPNYLLLANLYAAIEAQPQELEIVQTMMAAAASLREQIALKLG